MLGWFGILKYVEDIDEGRQLAMDDDNAQLAAQQMQLIKNGFNQIHKWTGWIEDSIEQNAPDDPQLPQLFDKILNAVSDMENYLNTK
tara:strand:+ start:1402 stop:1662 length:261 start_codon:yes stop_codon:yes gene_type:complete